MDAQSVTEQNPGQTSVEDRIADAIAGPAPSGGASAAFVPGPDWVDENLGETNQNPPGISLFQLLLEDLRTHESDPFMQGFWAIAVHRFGNWRMDIRPKLLRAPFSILYKILYRIVEWTCGISIPYTVLVGRRVHLWHHGGMILGARAIGNDCHLRQNTTIGIARRGVHRSFKPVIEDRCDIGAGAVLIGPITIGHDSQIGANAVVTKDIPPFSVAVGIPAKVIRSTRDD